MEVLLSGFYDLVLLVIAMLRLFAFDNFQRLQLWHEMLVDLVHFVVLTEYKDEF